MLTPDFVKLSHNGASDAQASVYLWEQNRTVLYFCASLWYWFSGMGFQFQFLVRVSVTGLFVPLHFHSRERTGHRENFRSRGTFVPWNIRSRGAKSPRTFVPWIFRSCRTFAPQERMFQKLSFHGTFAPLEPSLHKQLSCPLTFAPVAYLRLLRRLVRAAVL